MRSLQKQQIEGGATQCIPGRPYQPTLRERLMAQKAELTQRMADVDKALTALDGAPNFEQVLDAVNQAS